MHYTFKVGPLTIFSEDDDLDDKIFKAIKSASSITHTKDSGIGKFFSVM